MSVQEAYDRWAAQYDDNRNRTRDLNMHCLRRADLPLAGGQARFTPDGSDQEQLVPAWRHSVSEFVTAAMRAGFELQRMAEPGFEDDAVPRLLQLWQVRR